MQTFIHRFQIQICICFGMVGFLIAVFIVTKKGQTDFTPYGEIIIQNKLELIDTMLSKRTTALKDTIRKLGPQKGEMDKDKLEREKNLKTAIQVLRNTLTQRYAIDYSKADTGTSIYNQYLYPNKVQFLQKLDSVDWSNDNKVTETVTGFVIDTCRFLKEVPARYPATFTLKQNKRKVLVAFVSDYPQFGLWIVLTIAQMTLWFLLFPLLTGNVINLQSTFKKSYQVSIKGILTNSIIPFLFVAIFCICFYELLADNLVIKDEYFLSDFNQRMLWYALPGYLVAIYGFGSYISLARQVDLIDKKPKESLAAATSDITALYTSLKNAFDNAFLASAVILSLFVLWSGVTISAINSIDSIKFFSGLTGKPLIPGDFIYLMGLLHTCILLAFYLPVKLKFNSLSLTKSNAGPDQGGSSLKTLFSTLSDNIGTLLVTTSPIIASLAHTLFSALQKS